MRLPMRWILPCFALVGCSRVPESVAVAVVAEPVIYGTDDRVEADSRTAVPWLSKATARAVALVPVVAPAQGDAEDAGAEDAGSDHDWAAHSAGDRFQLCAEERFGAQPSLADCSAVLLSNDIVITAGHCFDEADTCGRYLYAVSYARAEDSGVSEPTFMRCDEILIREVGQLSDGSPIDYALVRLERPYQALAPVLRSDSVQSGEHVATIGFPEGLPLKIDPKGEVLAADSTGFRLITDAYHGSSGSGVYDTTGRLAGVLTGGQRDFDWDTDRGCEKSRVIPNEEAGEAERAMHVWIAVARACFQRPELSLCAGVVDDRSRELHDPVARDPVAPMSSTGGSKSSKPIEPQRDPVEGSAWPRSRQLASLGALGRLSTFATDAGHSRQSKATDSGCSLAHGARGSGCPHALFCAMLLVRCRVQMRRRSSAR
jgi:hypothetical protein